MCNLRDKGYTFHNAVAVWTNKAKLQGTISHHKNNGFYQESGISTSTGEKCEDYIGGSARADKSGGLREAGLRIADWNGGLDGVDEPSDNSGGVRGGP